MSLTKKIDRARQWAGEKMGAEARTSQSDEFQMLEAEMASRQSGMENLQKSAGVYFKWASRRCDAIDEKTRCHPQALLGRSMATHAKDFEHGSEFGTCLTHVGRVNERIADLHTNYTDDVNSSWLQHLERSVAMMKEYQTARKKLENRRLAYDASLAKMHKSKRDDFRVEDEMRVCKSKFDDTTEDVLRRMQDIKDAEADNVAAVTSLLDAELAYHEQAAEELRRTRQTLVDVTPMTTSGFVQDDPNVGRARQNPTQYSRDSAHDDTASTSQRMPPRRFPGSQALPTPPPPPPASTRPPVVRAATLGVRSASNTGTSARTPSITRNATDMAAKGTRVDDLTDDESVGSDSASPGWGNRSVSSATSHDSLARINSAPAVKKAPPPPPPPFNRAKKPPPPPVPMRRANIGY
ncbi:hypothetical protein CDD82_5076 [Ophiocordyceps australis]|uniref:BAR domain-containing protein n=1 Tax=Ophiocordyceps australis TaxID=1399860 RepID=A0A2C5ZTQ2_9HYPO|nr:hypothetical protein CDD82_5076 [Ophiocordyceps australis]